MSATLAAETCWWFDGQNEQRVMQFWFVHLNCSTAVSNGPARLRTQANRILQTVLYAQAATGSQPSSWRCKAAAACKQHLASSHNRQQTPECQAVSSKHSGQQLCATQLSVHSTASSRQLQYSHTISTSGRDQTHKTLACRASAVCSHVHHKKHRVKAGYFRSMAARGAGSSIVNVKQEAHTAQYSAPQHSTAQHSTAQCRTAQCCAAYPVPETL